MMLNTDGCGRRVPSSQAGCRIATGLGPTFGHGAGPGSMMRLGVSHHSTMADGCKFVRVGTGHPVVTAIVRFMHPH